MSDAATPTKAASAARIAIIVAMDREIAPLIRAWRRAGRRVRRGKYGAASSYQCEDVVVLVSGIGAEYAGMAAAYAPDPIGAKLIVSAGLAGALRDGVVVGSVLRPLKVVDAATGEDYPTERDTSSSGVLVTAASVVSQEQKRELAEKYGAAAVDMEAAAIANVAREAGVDFAAVKAISDGFDFEMPPMDRFITSGGDVNLLKLIGYAALRPRIWKALNELRKNSKLAAEALAKALEKVIAGDKT